MNIWVIGTRYLLDEFVGVAATEAGARALAAESRVADKPFEFALCDGYDWGPPVLEFSVIGHPIGQGALSPKGRNAKTGRIVMAHSNAKSLKPWRAQIAEMAKQTIERCGHPKLFPIESAVAVELLFTMPTSAASLKQGRAYPTVKNATNSDLDHLERAIYDALTGVVFLDDALVVDAAHPKTYPAGSTAYTHPQALPEPGVTIRVHVLPIPEEGTPNG